MADNPPAFPVTGIDPWKREVVTHTGMTLRDYFANGAMAAIISDAPDFSKDPAVICRVVAQCAYQLADAMLAERAK